MQTENKGTDAETVALKAVAVPVMLSIIGVALNAISVHIMISRFPPRDTTPDTDTTVIKVVTTMTRNKRELADNTPKTLLVKAQVRTLTIPRLQ